jgi:YYY domain-containing protein
MQYLAVLVWFAVFAGVATLGYPLAARLFGRFRSGGVGFALPIALVTIWLPVYWLGKLSFGPLTVAAGLAVLVGVAAVLALDLTALGDGEVRLADGLAADRGAVVEVVVVFVAAFLFLVAVRSVDPAVHAVGGEKYLDYGMLRTILRSGTLPPEDFWFAGEPVQYYYGGHLLAAILTVLTGTAPELAYNLALAGFYAMLVTAAYDLASNVAADRGVGARIGGLFATFFVGFASNLGTAGQLVLGLLPGELKRSLAPGVEALPLSGEGFSYWSASRVIVDNVDGRQFPTINEFPLFAWLNGDMHAHMMGTPFLLLAAAIGFALYLTPADDRRGRLGLLAAVPLLGFFQIVTSTWSFPSVFGVTYLALAFAPAEPTALLPRGAAERIRAVRNSLSESLADGSGAADTDGGTHRALAELERLLVPLGIVGGLVAVAAVLALPFLSRTMTGGSERSIEFLPAAARSGILELFAVHGAFLVIFGLYYLSRVRSGRGLSLVGATAAVGVVALLFPLDVLAFALPLLVVGWALLRFGDAGYETVLIVAGAGLVTIVEFVYVSEQAGPLRMNTVFKTYMQIWVLWGVGAGGAVAGLLGTARRKLSVPDGGAELGLRALGSVGVVVALLVVSTSVYGGFALSGHFADTGDPTLDATELPEWHGYEESELAAVDWLDRTADGDTVIVSAPAQGGTPGMYNWNSAIASSLTGVPTVVGWAHEVGYRGSDAYYARVDAVDALYTGSPADAASVIREHDVEYVWVGSAERNRYGDALVNFSDRPGYEPVFVDGDVVVYEVTESELPD